MQVNPSPVNPGLHVHLNEPIKFMQSALGLQLCKPDRHSLIS